MGRRIIALRYAGTCADCGADLPVGSPARYYGPRKIYGTECHADTRQQPVSPQVAADAGLNHHRTRSDVSAQRSAEVFDIAAKREARPEMTEALPDNFFADGDLPL